MQQLFPMHASAIARGVEPYAALDLPDAPPDRPYVYVNMVTSVDGTASLGGRVAGLGSRADRTMMHHIRASADAILWGAGTLRAEAVDPGIDAHLVDARAARGEPRQPLAVTLSASLNLDPGHRFFSNGRDRTLVLTTISALATASADLESVATLGVFGEERVDLAAALAELRHRWEVRHLLCEGGPSLNQQLLDLGLLDEVFWTIAPKLVGGSAAGLLDGDDASDHIRAQLDLLSLFEHEGELFARYRVCHEPPS